MFKLIIKTIYFIAIITSLYFAFTYIKQYDFDLLVQFQEYRITINTIAFVVLTITACLLVLLLINICCSSITFLLKLFGLKKRSLYKEQVMHLLKIFKYIALNQKSKASNILPKIRNNINEKLLTEYNIAASILKSDVSDQISSLSYLAKDSEFKNFARNRLAKTFFNLGLYDKALAIIDSSADDSELLEMLCDIYAEKEEWGKFKNVADKLLKIVNTKQIREKITNYYIKVAKYYINNDNESSIYLDACLAIDASNIRAIDLYCSLNIKLERGTNNVAILDNAFKNSPSFKIFELYTTNVDMDLQQIYQQLSNLVDAQDHREVFLSIAAYCNIAYSEYAALVR